MVLYINACIGRHSRTAQIARAFLNGRSDVCELRLDEKYLEPLNEDALYSRDQRIATGNFNHSYFSEARQFAEADEIVIAAPYWDLSFPSKLRVYLENICIDKLTFRYTSEGIPEGLCKAKKLTYITTAGGKYIPDYSYDYIKALSTGLLGIESTELIFAENLDIDGNDPEAIVEECIHRYCVRCSPLSA